MARWYCTWTFSALCLMSWGISPTTVRAEDAPLFDLTADSGDPGRAVGQTRAVARSYESPSARPAPPAVIPASASSAVSAPKDSKATYFDLTVDDAPRPAASAPARAAGKDEDVFDLTAEYVPGSASNDAADSFDLTIDHTQATTAPAATAPAADMALPRQARVMRVVDGDTYVLDSGHKVRLAALNTPEKSERIGPAVSARANKLLLYQEVTLQYGPVVRDGYGRLIADVQVDGRSVAETLLREGLGHMFIVPPSQPLHYDTLVEAQNDARTNGRGIWSEKRYQGPLHITSYHANARGDDRENLMGEYLRIANVSGKPLDIGGFTLANQAGQVFTFPSVIIPAGYTFQVFSGKGEVQGGHDTAFKIFWNSDLPIWNNDEDTATLRDAAGRWVDEVRHAPKRTHPKTS